MTTILVSALISENGRALFAHRPDGSWELPAEPLRDLESIEDALARLLHEGLGLDCDPKDFLDTYYQRGTEGEGVIRNVFRVDGWSGSPCLRSLPYSELKWMGHGDLAEVQTTETQRAILRDGLTSALPANSSPANLEWRTSGEAALPGAPITILTGPAAAGKSTIAGLLCLHAERAAHIEVDLLRDMVIAGYASPIPGESNPTEAAEQARLSSANAVAVARNFSLAGYEVVVDAVLETQEALDHLLRGLDGLAAVYVITLLPDEQTLWSRDAERAPDLQLGQRCLELRSIYESNGERRGLHLDNSGMSKAETVAWILANRDDARVL